MSEILGGDTAPATPAVAPATPAVETAHIPETSSPESEAQVEQPKQLSPTEKRIKELTWRAHEAERRHNREAQERAREQQEAAEVRRQLNELTRRASMPKLEEHNFDQQKFMEAVEQHIKSTREQETRAAQENYQRQSQAAAQYQLQSHVDARTAEAEIKYPDFRDVVNNPAMPPLASTNPALFGALITHEQFPDLTYYLGKNISEALRLSQLPPAKSLIELGKIAAKLSASPTQSKAPAPVPTVGSNAEVKKTWETMSQGEYEKARRKARGLI